MTRIQIHNLKNKLQPDLWPISMYDHPHDHFRPVPSHLRVSPTAYEHTYGHFLNSEPKNLVMGSYGQSYGQIF